MDRTFFGRQTNVRRAARLCAIGCAIACLAALAPFGPRRAPPRRQLLVDPKTVTPRPPAADGETLCVASASDGRIASASVVDDGTGGGGLVGLALPPGYVGPVDVKCTSTDPETGEVSVLQEDDVTPPVLPPGGGPCDRFSFQPGYYDGATSTWHDRCTGRTTLLTEKAAQDDDRPEVLAPERCPIVAERKVVWVHFAGDSVMRGAFLFNMLQAGVNLDDEHTWLWGGEKFPVTAYRLGMKGDAEHQVWFTYQWSFLNKNHGPPAVRNWGEFVKQRKKKSNQERRGHKAPTTKDPAFANERTPDVIFYGPGYHASQKSASWFGDALAAELKYWRKKAKPRSTSVHLLLNMMPATWLIPEKYANDRPHRTELNEYRKNLAIIETARKSDLVRSVVDAFSVELPFHRGEGALGIVERGDAVHISDWRIERVIGQMILDRLCNSGSDGIASAE